jgi:hypothetical protein
LQYNAERQVKKLLMVHNHQGAVMKSLQSNNLDLVNCVRIL